MKNLLALILALLVSQTSFAKIDNLNQRNDIQTFINDMVTKHGFKKKELNTLFAEATIQPDIIKSISKPYESKPWPVYKPFFVNDKRAKAGAQFWKENEALLQKAEKEFGVNAEVIVAIIGVESNYGQNKGSYKVLDALTTLAFDYPPRSKFFKQELEHFLLLSKETDVDLKTAKGSYAGAMGQPQFIPSSYRHYAVDFSGNGKKDLQNNMADVIGSVANYFKEHHWEQNKPVADKAILSGKKYQTLKEQGLKPKLTIKELAGYGIKPDAKSISKDKLAAFVTLKDEKHPEYWVGYQNFYVITRYNRSPLYAMAVYQLSERIKTLHQNA